ncbi:Alpha/beta_hydrolase family protein [Hexamita inflata]|uniref:Alpha/beta hydrolase family protein n=1 Tax=Hexamita inflata TaxID=28002 RepID=A0AA86Q793_9EUKA|nr:Alpha/beta hydrolase family protein [Hexamita inflata]
MNLSPSDFELDKNKFKTVVLKNGLKINTYNDGPSDGIKILVIHGAQSFIQMLSPLITTISQIYNVLAIDLPGHGQSDQLEQYSQELIEDIIIEVLEYTNFYNFYVIGHSFGGYLAVRCRSQAKYQKFNPQGVVSFCPAGLMTLIIKTPMTPEAEQYIRKDFKNNLLIGFKPKTPNPDLPLWLSELLVDMLVNQLASNSDKSIGIMKFFSQFKFSERFECFETANTFDNVIIVYALGDKLVDSVKSHEYIQQHYKNISSVVVEGAHEFPMVEPALALEYIKKCVNAGQAKM